MNRTFCIIKPDVTERRVQDQVFTHVFNAGFVPLMIHSLLLPDVFVADLYLEHKGRDYYDRLFNFMTSGISIACILWHQSPAAWSELRQRMGPSDIAKRKTGQIRAVWGDPNIEHRNAIHGSDSAAAAEREISLALRHKIM